MVMAKASQTNISGKWAKGKLSVFYRWLQPALALDRCESTHPPPCIPTSLFTNWNNRRCFCSTAVLRVSSTTCYVLSFVSCNTPVSLSAAAASEHVRCWFRGRLWREARWCSWMMQSTGVNPQHQNQGGSDSQHSLQSKMKRPVFRLQLRLQPCLICVDTCHLNQKSTCLVLMAHCSPVHCLYSGSDSGFKRKKPSDLLLVFWKAALALG